MNCLIISIFNFDYKIFISFNSIILFDYYEITFFYFPLALDKHGERISVSCLTFKYFGRWFNLKSSPNLLLLMYYFFFKLKASLSVYMCVFVTIFVGLISVSCFTVSYAVPRPLSLPPKNCYRHTDNLAFYVRLRASFSIFTCVLVFGPIFCWLIQCELFYCV